MVALVELGHVGRVPVHNEALQQDLVETVWDIRDNDHLAVVGYKLVQKTDGKFYGFQQSNVKTHYQSSLWSLKILRQICVTKNAGPIKNIMAPLGSMVTTR